MYIQTHARGNRCICICIYICVWIRLIYFLRLVNAFIVMPAFFFLFYSPLGTTTQREYTAVTRDTDKLAIANDYVTLNFP